MKKHENGEEEEDQKRQRSATHVSGTYIKINGVVVDGHALDATFRVRE